MLPKRILILASLLKRKRHSHIKSTFYNQLIKLKINTAYFFGDFINILNNNPPMNPPYKVLFKGLEVIAQVPLIHPI